MGIIGHPAVCKGDPRPNVKGRLEVGAKLPRRLLAALGLVIAVLALVCAFISFYISNTPLRLLSIGLGVAMFLIMALTSENVPIRTGGILLFAVSMPFALVNCWTTDFKSLIIPLSFLSGLGIAWYIFEYRKTRVIFENFFFGYLGLTVYLIVVRGYGSTEFNEFFLGIGRNGYSAILVATACGYVVSRELRALPASPLLMGVALACSVFLYGRSSITALAVLFAVVAFKRAPKVSTLTMIALIGLAIYGYELLNTLGQLDTNFKAGVDSERWDMLTEYRHALNPVTIGLGVDLRTLPTVVENDGNPHNAFIRLHSSIGVSALVFVSTFLWSIVSLIRQGMWLRLAVLVIILFRAFTDIILIFGTVDVFFVPLLFYPYFQAYWSEGNALQLVKNRTLVDGDYETVSFQ
jgi:hypothetical protein